MFFLLVIIFNKYIFCYIQSHDDTSDDHQKMTISDYRIQAKRVEKRVCPKHTAYLYSLGCRVCVQLFCVQCVSPSNLCGGGTKVLCYYFMLHLFGKFWFFSSTW